MPMDETASVLCKNGPCCCVAQTYSEVSNDHLVKYFGRNDLGILVHQIPDFGFNPAKKAYSMQHIKTID